MRHIAAALLWGALLGGPTVTWAQAPAAPPAAPADKAGGSNLDEVAHRVAKLTDELKSPFCPGKTLQTCTSYQAFELRREIKQMVEAGKSDDEILTTLQARFDHDDFTIANPVQPWYTALVPFLPFLVGGLLVIWVFRRWTRRRRGEDDPAPAPAPAIAGEDAERLARLRAQVAREEE
ncbi:MAG: cytochrome c-type biogenesis protein CcmH [Myxococcales bacterium]|nr:cytochrome c-type biogenesis protein CcmH [Myxococcales bacterium]